jgi:hypothetical protein
MGKKPRITGVDLTQARPGHFVATIHPGRGREDLSALAAISLDRIPDRYGRIRAFLTAEECRTLLDAGYEVRLHHHYPVEPVDPNVIASDEEAKRWLKERLAEIRPDASAPRRRRRKKS